jgi:hypothetical protein
MFLTGFVVGVTLMCAVEKPQTNKEIDGWRSAFYKRPCPPLQVKVKLPLARAALAWSGADYLNTKFNQTLHTTTPQPGMPIVVVSDGSGKGMCKTPTQMEYISNNGDIGFEATRFDAVLCVSNIIEAQSYPGEDQTIRGMGKLGIKGATAHALLHVWMGKPSAEKSHPVWESGLFAKDANSFELGPVVLGVLVPHFKGCKR